ncbi:MAG: hypothetical protein J0I28_09780 [Caulobacterales bacterium]|nr:hypothetical protein [Caulobacterales bacterium]
MRLNRAFGAVLAAVALTAAGGAWAQQIQGPAKAANVGSPLLETAIGFELGLILTLGVGLYRRRKRYGPTGR